MEELTPEYMEDVTEDADELVEVPLAEAPLHQKRRRMTEGMDSLPVKQRRTVDGARVIYARPGAVASPGTAHSVASEVGGLPAAHQQAVRSAAPSLPYGAVVKLFVQRVGHSYSMPWRSQPQQAATASGFLLDATTEIASILDKVVEMAAAAPASIPLSHSAGDVPLSKESQADRPRRPVRNGSVAADRPSSASPSGGHNGTAAVSSAAAEEQLRKLFLLAGGEFRWDRVILTNAHVVHRQTSVLVQRHGCPGKHPGRILCVGRGCDLALLTVDSPTFWEGPSMVKPLRLSSAIPSLDENVTCVGYPMGGNNVCVTRGIVSRIDMHSYAVGQNPLLTIQIDAALNPGNSGGPCFDGHHQVVGVAYGTLKKAASAGYIIPVRVVRLFIQQYVAFGRFPGVADVGIICQNLENPSLRSYLRIPESEAGGVRVRKVSLLGPANGLVEDDDVVLAVNGQTVAQDGTIEFRAGERIDASYLVSCTAMYTKATLRILRKGETLEVDIECRPPVYLVPRLDGVDAHPSYLVFGGLVFVPLTLPWMTEVFRRRQPSHIRRYLHESPEKEGQEVIVLSHVLAHNINMGYHSLSHVIVKSVNGREVDNMRQLADAVSALVAEQKDGPKIVDFLFLYGTKVALDIQLCKEKDMEILRLHAIHSACSPDLAGHVGWAEETK